jgi:hypothetical protein
MSLLATGSGSMAEAIKNAMSSLPSKRTANQAIEAIATGIVSHITAHLSVEIDKGEVAVMNETTHVAGASESAISCTVS